MTTNWLSRLKEKIWSQIIIIYARYLLGGAFVYASIVKIQGERFMNGDGSSSPINSPGHYFETLYRSGIYWKFIGIGQLVAGALLMTQKYSKLGAVMNLPIVINVFVITISYQFNGTPIITGTMVFANLLILTWDWNEFRILFNLPYQEMPRNTLIYNPVWTITGVILLAFTLLERLVGHYGMLYWLVGCITIGTIGFVIGIRKLIKNKN